MDKKTQERVEAYIHTLISEIAPDTIQVGWSCDDLVDHVGDRIYDHFDAAISRESQKLVRKICKSYF